MPEVSALSHLAQLSAVAATFSVAGFAAGYCGFLKRHRITLHTEEALRNERIAAEDALLEASRTAAQVPLFHPAYADVAPYSPPVRADVPKPPPAVIFDIDRIPYIAPEAVTFTSTTETVLNPPIFGPTATTSRRAPSRSPLAVEAAPEDRQRWADMVGPDVDRLTVTDVEHLTVEKVRGEVDRIVRGRHGSFRLDPA